MKNPPIIIIGAGRSGTNILRDSICTFPGFGTWPCDEINYIWRHGNISKDTDRFTENDATPKARSYIIRAFKKFERSSGNNYVVEKTCANSLKIPFIEAVFPNAKYIFLVRDGRDVASSAKQRWTAPLELKYIWKKAKYVPLVDLPYYGMRYFRNRIMKLASKERRLAFWGPVYPGMFKDLKDKTLIEVCGRQWEACVETAHADLLKIENSRVHRLTYESFVENPVEEMSRIMNFIGVEVPEPLIQKSVKGVSPKSVGNFGKYLSEREILDLEKIVGATMSKVYPANQ